MKIIGVNGIYVPYRKNKSTDKLLTLLSKKYETHDFNYSEVFVYMTLGLLHTRRLAKQLMEIVKPDDVVFGHSYGAAVINQAAWEGMKCKAIALFSGACNAEVTWPSRCCKKLINVYNEKDWILKVGDMIPFSVLGDYGMGPRSHVINVDADEVNIKKNRYCHTDYFLDENIEIWKELIEDLCENRLGD